MAKKKSKNSLPKRIGGVRIPKRVRKGPLAALLASRHGQEILVGSLVALTGAAAGKKVADEHSPKKTGRKALSGLAGAGAAGATLSFAFGEAARSFLDALQHGPDAQAWTPDSEAGASKKKPSTSAAGRTPRPDLDL
jgi:hypothetical protein